MRVRRAFPVGSSGRGVDPRTRATGISRPPRSWPSHPETRGRWSLLPTAPASAVVEPDALSNALLATVAVERGQGPVGDRSTPRRPPR